jgi:hypothetical protein
MKISSLFVVTAFALLSAACGNSDTVATPVADAPAIPDSVPQRVVLGKEADWAYKPDTMMHDFILGEGKGLRDFYYDNGSNGESKDGISVRPFLNSKQTEKLTLYTVKAKGNEVPFAFRVEKFVTDPKMDKSALNFTGIPNFVSGHGIYIGMPVDYVQSVYKGQPMMKWTKGDTTYLTYAPLEKDKSHFHRYTYTDYSAQYKFVNDQCRVIEMNVLPEVFTK